MVSLAQRRSMVEYLQRDYAVSQRRACRIAQIARSTCRSRPNQAHCSKMIDVVTTLSYRYPRFGYRKIHTLSLHKGQQVSRERVRLIRKHEGLQVLKTQKKKRLLGCSTTLLKRAEYANHVWSYDFVHDQTEDGRRVKYLTIIDEFTHESLMIWLDRSITSTQVISCLGFLFDLYGKPTCIKSDNGPEFIAKQVQSWLKTRHVQVHYIDPGSPWQNGHNESFNTIFRDGCLNRWAFYSLTEARRVVEQWQDEYNTIRPHGSIGMMTPHEFAAIHRQHLFHVA